MPAGPKGQKRPADVISNAVHVMRIATGEIEEDRGKALGQCKSGKAGGRARAEKLAAEKRTEIAKKRSTQALAPE